MLINMLPLKGLVFVGLNLLRALSIVTTLLVFSATIRLMVNDSKAYNIVKSSDTLDAVKSECDYIPDTDIPSTTWGLFWAQLNRSWILCLCVICVLSESCMGPLEQIFNSSIPILGPSFSTVPLGFIQIMISCSLLSHYLQGFSLVTPWMLFFNGIVNVTIGVAFGPHVKLRRSLLRHKRDELLLLSTVDIEKATTFRPLRQFRKQKVKTRVDGAGRDRNENYNESHHKKNKPVSKIRKPLDAFQSSNDYGDGELDKQQRPHRRVNVCSCSNSVCGEILRHRARRENMRIEENEGEASKTYSSTNLAQDFLWNSYYGSAVPRQATDVRDSRHNYCGEAERFLNDNEYPLSKEETMTQNQATDRACKHRSLVLSKMVRQVKRGSRGAAMVASRVVSKKRRQNIEHLPSMPLLKQPSEWEEVDRSKPSPHPPSPSYIPGRHISPIALPDGYSPKYSTKHKAVRIAYL